MANVDAQRVAQRVQALEVLFREVAAHRMAGVPILHESLKVEAVGFEPDAAGQVAVGVLVTPWFMNLVRLPLQDDDGSASGSARLAPGVSATRAVGLERFEFIGAFEEGFGAYEACSLFSPMFEFVDHEAARATAQAVLDELRREVPAEAVGQAGTVAPVMPDRRALLFGRSSRPGAGL